MIPMTVEDRRSNAFKKIKEYINQEIEDIRLHNENILEEAKTNFNRGGISALKRLLEEMTRTVELDEHDGYDMQLAEELVDG